MDETPEKSLEEVLGRSQKVKVSIVVDAWVRNPEDTGMVIDDLGEFSHVFDGETGVIGWLVTGIEVVDLVNRPPYALEADDPMDDGVEDLGILGVEELD